MGLSFGWIGDAIQGVTSVFLKDQKLKEIRASGRLQIEEAKIAGKLARLAADTKASNDYDIEALRQQQFSWKDEWLLLVMTMPFVGSFIPGVQEYVDKGWEYVAKAPTWYTTIFIGISASVYGLRWMVGRKT